MLLTTAMGRDWIGAVQWQPGQLWNVNMHQYCPGNTGLIIALSVRAPAPILEEWTENTTSNSGLSSPAARLPAGSVLRRLQQKLRHTLPKRKIWHILLADSHLL